MKQLKLEKHNHQISSQFKIYFQDLPYYRKVLFCSSKYQIPTDQKFSLIYCFNDPGPEKLQPKINEALKASCELILFA